MSDIREDKLIRQIYDLEDNRIKLETEIDRLKAELEETRELVKIVDKEKADQRNEWASTLKRQHEMVDILHARLQAAEAIITTPKPDCCVKDLTHLHWNENINRWRKAKGETIV